MNAGCCGTECFCYFAGWWEGHSHGRKSSLRLGRILIYKVLEFIHQFSQKLWPCLRLFTFQLVCSDGVIVQFDSAGIQVRENVDFVFSWDLAGEYA